MKIHDCVQGEGDWALVRAGKVTASDADNILTPEFKARTGDTPKRYLYQKIAERLRKGPVVQFSTYETEFGQMLEDEARAWFHFNHEHEMKTVGFCEQDDGTCGCSPDALLDEDGGLELKCPQSTNHVKYLVEGILPKDYAVQVHFSMYVTGRAWWYFVSYHRPPFPKFVLKVQRDEAICAKIHETVAAFNGDLNAAMEKLANL